MGVMTATTTEKVQNAIVVTYRATISLEEKVNKFLDTLNEIRGEYQHLNSEWSKVNEMTSKFVSECHSKDDLTNLYISISGMINLLERSMEKILSYLRRMLPSIANDLEENFENMKEIHSDLALKISDDPELLSAEQNLINLGF